MLSGCTKQSLQTILIYDLQDQCQCNLITLAMCHSAWFLACYQPCTSKRWDASQSWGVRQRHLQHHSFGMTDIITLKTTIIQTVLIDQGFPCLHQTGKIVCITVQLTSALILCNVIECKYEYKLNTYKMHTYDGIHLFYCTLIFSVRKNMVKIITFLAAHLTHVY